MTSHRSWLPLAACLFLLFAGGVIDRAESYSLAQDRKSPERKAILDVVRGPVEHALHRPVIFQVHRLNVTNGWAFLDADMFGPDQKPISFRGTPYQQAYDAGGFSRVVFALLHKRGGKWREVTWVLGPTDVSYIGWDRKYGAPSSIFPPTH